MRLYRSGTLGLAIKGEIGSLVCRFGERVGSERVIYNPWTYASFHRTALETAPVMVDGIMNLFPNVKTVVDFGCGTGVYMSEFRKHGVTAEGYEYSSRARDIARKSLQLELHAFDLKASTNIGRTFDLSISIEVAEHLPPDLGDRLVDICCGHAPLVVFTAGHPGQSGHGHINLQLKSYWIERFERRGFRFDRSSSSGLEDYLRERLIRGLWLADNVGVYCKDE